MNTKRPALMERTCSFGAGLLYGGIDGRENEPDFSAFPNLYESYTKPIQGDCIMSAIRDVHRGGITVCLYQHNLLYHDVIF